MFDMIVVRQEEEDGNRRVLVALLQSLRLPTEAAQRLSEAMIRWVYLPPNCRDQQTESLAALLTSRLVGALWQHGAFGFGMRLDLACHEVVLNSTTDTISLLVQRGHDGKLAIKVIVQPAQRWVALARLAIIENITNGAGVTVRCHHNELTRRRVLELLTEWSQRRLQEAQSSASPTPTPESLEQIQRDVEVFQARLNAL